MNRPGRGRARISGGREPAPLPPPEVAPFPPPPQGVPPPPPQAQGEQNQLFGLLRETLAAMQQQQQQSQPMLMQQQQQMQQMLIQQQQNFFQQLAPQGNGGMAQAGRPNARPIGLPEFVKLAPTFDGKSSDPTVAETWINEVEKAFAACQIADEAKMGLAEYQLKQNANDWWAPKKANLREPTTWEGFKVMFYEKYFPSST